MNSGPKNRREPKKIISSLNTENDVGKSSSYAPKSITEKYHFRFTHSILLTNDALVTVEALTVLNLESDVHAAYERAVRSCNPGRIFFLSKSVCEHLPKYQFVFLFGSTEKYWELSDEDLEKQVKKMRRINKAWEVLYIHFIESSSRQ